MTGKWNVLTAAALAAAIGACSSRTSNTDTAAGLLPGDTSTTLAPTPSIPNPGIDTGMVLDTTGNAADSSRADSVKSVKRDTTHQSAAGGSKQHKSTKPPSAKKRR